MDAKSMNHLLENIAHCLIGMDTEVMTQQEKAIAILLIKEGYLQRKQTENGWDELAMAD